MTRTLEMTLSLDSDEFLRRCCPACDREFKWRHTPSGEAPPYEVDEYHCPYCGRSATEFWTAAQVEYMKALAYNEVVEPSLRKIEDSMRSMGRRGGGLLRVTINRATPPPPVRPAERDDMRRVEAPCHPEEPIKVLDDWTGPVHCLVCGADV